MYSLFDCMTLYFLGVFVGVAMMLHYEDDKKKQAFRRYEQQRLAYSARRIRRIERGEF